MSTILAQRTYPKFFLRLFSFFEHDGWIAGIILLVGLIAAAIFCVLRTPKGSVLTFILKLVATLAYLLVAAKFVIDDVALHWGDFLVYGLGFSFFGDLFLEIKVGKKPDVHTVIGIICFSAAHLCYIVRIAGIFGYSIWTTVAAVVLVPLYFLTQKPLFGCDFGKHLPFCAFYLTILLQDAALCIYALFAGIHTAIAILCTVGLVLFLLSDMILTACLYGKWRGNELAVTTLHGLYYLSQLLLVISAIGSIFG